MAKTTVTQTFTKGLSKDASPFVLDASQLADVRNMIFERGLLYSRPGYTTVPSTTADNSQPVAVINQLFHPFILAPADVLVYQSGGPAGATKLRNLITTNVGGALFSDNVADAAGAAITPLDGCFPQGVSFNGILMLSGFTQGLVRFDPVANTYTIPLAEPYRFITVHLTRVIAACSAGAGVGAIQKVGWSKVGDETVWSGTYDSGTLILQEAEDGISGLSVLRNVIVVARPYGFHLGIPTGTGANPYDWKCYSKDDIGCCYPDTLAKHSDRLFFMSDHDVHTFDLSSITDIGEGIREELLQWALVYGVRYRGFVTHNYKAKGHPQYHLIPYYRSFSGLNQGTLFTPFPHYVYDIVEGSWSRHQYDKFLSDSKPYDGFPANWLHSINGTVNYTPRNAPGLVRYAPSTNTNLVNPAFTIGYAGWSLQAPVVPPAGLQWDGADGHTGLGCVSWTPFNPAAAQPNLTQTLSVSEGASKVEYSIWVKSEPGEAGVFNFFIQYQDEYRTPLSTHAVSQAPTAGVWTKLTHTAPSPPSGTRFIYFIIGPEQTTCTVGWKVDDALCSTQLTKFQYLYWNSESVCESTQSFTTGRLQLIAPDNEVTMLRVMLVLNVIAWDNTHVPGITMTVTNFLGDTTQNFTPTAPTIPTTGWLRLRWNQVAVGQFFQLAFNLTSAAKVEVRQVIVEHEAQPQEVRV